jgi:uncharacterized protein (DUF1330 family)
LKHAALLYSLHRDREWSGAAGFARQGMKAYLVLDLSVNDFGGFRKYIAEIPAFIAKHSGKYLVQGVQPTIIEGDWKPERIVIIEFPERENAEAFLGDPEIQDLFKLRHDTTTSKLVLADGCT